MSETFVGASSRGVELGRRLALSEIGPTSAYLEHPAPMPVGSELRITGDDGVELGVVVVRVCEQVAGADRSPGMFVRVVELAGEAETWWRGRQSSGDDPVFPEPAGKPPVAAAPAPTPEPEPAPASSGANGAGSTLQGISAAAALAAAEAEGRTVRDVATTVRMTPDQIKTITDLAPPESGGDDDADDDNRPKGKRRRRRKKKKN